MRNEDYYLNLTPKKLRSLPPQFVDLLVFIHFTRGNDCKKYKFKRFQIKCLSQKYELSLWFTLNVEKD